MKYIVIKKTGRVNNDFSCENIIRFTSRMNKYSEQSIVATSNFIVARIPDKQGDMASAERFFEKVEMYVTEPPKTKSYDEMKRICDDVYRSKMDIGHSLILKTVKNLVPDGNYDIIEL